jgi:hypothetical protein
VLSYRNMHFSVDSPNEGTVIVFIGHKLFKCKRRAFNNGGNNSNSRDKKYAFKLKKKKVQNNKPSSYNGNGSCQNFKSQDVVFSANSKHGTLSNDILIWVIRASGQYCKLIEGMFHVKDIPETITLEIGDSMMASKGNHSLQFNA